MSLMSLPTPYRSEPLPSVPPVHSELTSGPSASCTDQTRRSTSRWVWIAFAIIVLTATLVRFWGLEREGRWGDEYWQTRSYRLPLAYVVSAAQRQQQPPLDYIIGWALHNIEDSDRMRRAPAAFFGVLSVVACFALMRRLGLEWEGLVACALVAFSPFHWMLSQEARPYAISTAALLLTLWALARALNRPSGRRLLAYGFFAYSMTWTRGLLPMVVLLSIGVVIAAELSIAERKRRRTGMDARSALEQTGLATLLVMIATLPMLFYLLSSEAFTVLGTAGRRNALLFGQPFLDRVVANTWIWLQAPLLMFGSGSMLIMFLAMIGVWMSVKKRHVIGTPTRCVMAILGTLSICYPVVFSVLVPVYPINSRYGLFLVCGLAIFAAIAIVAGCRWLWGLKVVKPMWRHVLAVMFVGLFLCPPAYGIYSLRDQYFRPDWRGCAKFLRSRTTPDDVLFVFHDRPLGKAQTTFWGKYEWPPNAPKPLAEPAWSLACSQPHWRRLTSQRGRAFLVIRCDVGNGRADDYLRHGIQSAPSGLTLKKFRGLDVLYRDEPHAEPLDRFIRACDDLLALPKRYPQSDAMLLALRSRLELTIGDDKAAVRSWSEAMGFVPRRLHSWFVDALEAHTTALKTLMKERTLRAADVDSIRPGDNGS